MKTYNIVLDNQKAKRFKTHLRNMGVKYISGECGEHQYIQFDYEESEIADMQYLLDEVKCHCWAENIKKMNKK